MAESFTVRLPSRGTLAEELFWLQLPESLMAHELPKSKIFPIWSENSKVIVSRTNSRILWKVESCYDIKKKERIPLLSLICLLMGILPYFFQAISHKHMLFICIRSSLIKMIVSSVHSSWCWATDHRLIAWMRLHSGRKMSFLLFSLCFCNSRRKTVMWSLCSRWFEIEAHNMDRSWVQEQRQRVYKA